MIKPSSNISEIDKLIIRAGATSHFWLFCLHYDYEFFNKRRFLKQIAIAFQDVIDKYKNGIAISISVSLPPRAGKSYITSLFAAYWIGRFPELSVMRNTCTATLYDKFSYDTRAIVRSEKYKDVFPNIKLAGDKQNLGGWNLEQSKQVGYFGSGVGGSIIGFGANLAITDDLYKSMSDALSVTTRENVEMWKQSAHDSRKEKNCPEIFIGTRWAVDDIIGKAIESNKLTHSIIVAAMVDDRSFCEDVKSTEEYQKIKSEIDESIWSAEYMQSPYEVKGLLIPLGRLRLTQQMPIESTFRFAVVDPADMGGDKLAAIFCNCIIIGKLVNIYLEDVICNKDGIEVNNENIISKLQKNKSENVFIESNGVGLASALLLKKTINSLQLSTKLSPFNSSENKEVRILSNYEFVRDKFLFNQNYKEIKDYNTFITDLTTYSSEGDNKHKKDAMDVICMAAKVIKIKYNSILYS